MDPLKESLRQIWDGPCSCSGCQQRLTPLAFSCHGGHMFCLDCKFGLNECPVCSQAFNIDAPAALNRVLELLPKFCRYMGCLEIIDGVIRLREHETWCGHRPTQCKLCSWSEQVKDLFDHCMEKHFNFILETYVRVECIPYPPNYEATIRLVKTCGQIFWVTYGIDRASADVYAQIIWVPDGSVNQNLFVADVSFHVGSCVTLMTKPIIHQESDNGSDLNLFKVPLSTLTSSIDIVGQSVIINLVIAKT